MRMDRRVRKRLVIVLAVVAMLSYIPAGMFAAETSPNGLCEHHPAHTGWCGYSERSPEQPCTYICSICTAEDPDLEEGEWLHNVEGNLLPDFAPGLLPAVLADPAAGDPAGADDADVTSKITYFMNIYIGGNLYKGGDIIVTEGAGFSYQFLWAPNIRDGDTPLTAGDYFEIELFQIPGLNLSASLKSSLVIDNIRVGDWSLTYNKTTGKMVYRVDLNRYIQFFDPNTIMASLQGSGTFQGTQEDTPIKISDEEGMLTVEARPTRPVDPYPVGGVGWNPQTPPKFSTNSYPFGKGVKWTSANNPSDVPQIDWRSPFLVLLQERQEEFLASGDTALSAVNGNCLIEDKLDSNQRFLYPSTLPGHFASDGGRFENNAPFHVELPILVPGTGQILNGVSNLGNGNYDGPGEIAPYVTGISFEQKDGSGVKTASEMNALRQWVEAKAMRWTVYTDPRDGREVLYINLGVLGAKRGENDQGINWGMTKGSSIWPETRLNALIQECDNKAAALESGADSPLSLLDSRKDALESLLNRAIYSSDNADQRDEVREALTQWSSNYDVWRATPGIDPLSRLTDQSGNPLPLPDLPDALLQDLTDPSGKGGNVTATAEYKNFAVSLQNLRNDQEKYLDNRTAYRDGWEAVKAQYQETLEFYRDGQVFGFVIKVRTQASNPSMTTYSNNISVAVGDRQWSASDESKVTFSNTIIGNYALGSVVLQKADALYDTDADDNTDIQNIQKQQAGLAGAKFHVYCDSDNDGTNVPELNEKHLAHFLDKDASQLGDTYIYTHTGDQASGALEGEVRELEVGTDGRLILGQLALTHFHYLVETEAPTGYYLDDTPIGGLAQKDAVVYILAPNVSRAAKLTKIDSYSGMPVEGAQFALFKVDGARETQIKVTETTINGHKTYWPDASSSGSETLLTNQEGSLCIHGLNPGSYVLRETAPAPGYKAPTSPPEFPFTLEEKLPADKSGYDEDWHYLLNSGSPLTNEPETTEVTFKKVGVNNAALAGAAYGLFRFKGSETQWKTDCDNTDLWEAVNLTKTDGEYFHTDNEIRESSLQLTGAMTLAVSDDSGEITIRDIPVGHYSISEIEAPNGYIRDYASYYFHVNGDTLDETIKIYRALDGGVDHQVADNTLHNYTHPVKLALIKYDAAEMQPDLIGGTEITNTPMEDRVWYYQEQIATTGGRPLSGAVYKLFLRIGGDTNINPDPEELTSTTLLSDAWDGTYDQCLAVGTTDENGVLRLDQMTDKGGGLPYLGDDKGLTMGNYYLVEVKAPEGYRLVQEPVWFIIDSTAFPDSGVPGLIQMSSNTKLDYGLKIIKTDEISGKTLPGAEFTLVRRGEDQSLTFTYDVANNQYRVESGQGSFETLVTGDDGTLILAGLTPGGYTLTETKAPQGYQAAQSMDVDIAEATAPTAENLVLQDITVQNQRLKGEMILYKSDGETLQPLPGAQFQLYYTKVTKILETDQDYDPDRDPDLPAPTRSEDLPVGEVLTTDENGRIVFEDLDWTGEFENYFLQEVAAPGGYVTDASKLQFTIGPDSFSEDGTPIPVVIRTRNFKGVMGLMTLHKVDADNPEKKLEDAHFHLFREVAADQWVAYGKGIYITGEDGTFTIPLPPGNYSLMEMKAPDGYLGDLGFYHDFTVVDTGDGSAPEPVELTVTNPEGSAGVYLRKTVQNTEIPIPGVAFNFFQGMIDQDLLYFERVEEGLYRCVGVSGANGGTKDVSTDDNGELRLIFGPEYLVDPADPLSPFAKGIFYQEVSAPLGVAVDDTISPIVSINFNSPACLTAGFWSQNFVNNALKSAAEIGELSVVLMKQGEDGKPLPGAKFELYDILFDTKVDLATGVTDQNGQIIFQNNNNSLNLGRTYYVKEIEAPAGYVLDETVYEVTMGANALDKDFKIRPVYVNDGSAIENRKIKGTVELTKVEGGNNNAPLAGAQFELFRRTGSGDWEHYGDPRYTTGGDGKITLTLPAGSYRWIERKAPIGYLLDTTWREFTIAADGEHVTVGPIENEVDPTPRGDVTVTKADQNNLDRRLPGAKFRLYSLGADGVYALYDDTVYITDSDGAFTVPGLPVGSYAFREIEAPVGYQLADRFWPFSISRAGESVAVTITNAGYRSGGGSSTDRVPDPDAPPWEPDDTPSPSPDPGDSPDPSQPTEPGGDPDPGKPAEPGDDPDPGTPTQPGDGPDPGRPEQPGGGLPPKTGEHTGLLFWAALMAMSAAGLAILIRPSLHKPRRDTEAPGERGDD